MSESGHGDSGDCLEIFARLSEYLDEELDPELCSALEAHLSDCPPCVTFLESLRRTIRLIRSTDSPSLPDGLEEKIVEAYERLESAGKD